MNYTLDKLRNALIEIGHILKPQKTPLSLLIITGIAGQGKSALLRQSRLKSLALSDATEIYYNNQGIIIELNEELYTTYDNISTVIKTINTAVSDIRITGLLLCIDIGTLPGDSLEVSARLKEHYALFNAVSASLTPLPYTAMIFTRLDTIAGFSEFFHNEHANELQKGLGFSFPDHDTRAKLVNSFKTRFDQFIEMLGQQVIHKLHPARSSLKRTLIREFPLQLGSLKNALQYLLQHLPEKITPLEALYFTSAEQGGVSFNRLTQKIQNEYALILPNKSPQAVNYKAFFITGAIRSLQTATIPVIEKNSHQKYVIGGTILAGILFGGIIIKNHLTTAHYLAEASKELLLFNPVEATPAKNLRHITGARDALTRIKSFINVPTIDILQGKLHDYTHQFMHGLFLPQLLAELETVLTGTDYPERYAALKIYLMLGTRENFNKPAIITWFKDKWEHEYQSDIDDRLILLNDALTEPFQPLPINHGLVQDTRTFMNALPADYLYYQLIRAYFPHELLTFDYKGFQLPTRELPIIYTKQGFASVMQILPELATQLQQENQYLLQRKNLPNLATLLEETYCNNYAMFWQNFINKTMPLGITNYEESYQLLTLLYQNGEFQDIIARLRQETGPESGPHAHKFNRLIASKFASFNLAGTTGTHALNQNLGALHQFLLTLAMVNDNGFEAFNLTRAKFTDSSNPLKMLEEHNLPHPVSAWIQQINADLLSILMRDSKQYINQQWQKLVYEPWQQQIAGRFPFDNSSAEVEIADFDRFFAPNGILNSFINIYLTPFLDMSKPHWEAKVIHNHTMPLINSSIDELIRANVITNMFFPNRNNHSHIEFSLQKINFNDNVESLELAIGNTTLFDDQNSANFSRFTWPAADVRLNLLYSTGEQFAAQEKGVWGIFRLLQQLAPVTDSEDSRALHLALHEGDARYLMMSANRVNPFIPGILTGFALPEKIV